MGGNNTTSLQQDLNLQLLNSVSCSSFNSFPNTCLVQTIYFDLWSSMGTVEIGGSRSLGCFLVMLESHGVLSQCSEVLGNGIDRLGAANEHMRQPPTELQFANSDQQQLSKVLSCPTVWDLLRCWCLNLSPSACGTYHPLLELQPLSRWLFPPFLLYLLYIFVSSFCRVCTDDVSLRADSSSLTRKCLNERKDFKLQSSWT